MPLRSHAFATLAVAAALTLGACADPPTTPSGPTPAASPALNRAPADHDEAAFEQDYIRFTIDHHRGGVALGELCLQRAQNQDLRNLCEEAVAAQLNQIQELRRYLRRWYGVDYRGQIPEMARQEVQRLRPLSGDEFQNEFLTAFSMGHLQIIERSVTAKDHLYHGETKSVARVIILTQSRQVIQMQDWDCTWYGDCGRGLRERAEAALATIR